jgi:3-methylcrotonyl-CoA carboxylase alpha subunit
MNEQLVAGELVLTPRVSRSTDGTYRVVLDGQVHSIIGVAWLNGELKFELDGQRYVFHALVNPREVQVAGGPVLHRFQRREPGVQAADKGSGGELTSQMPGKVLKLLCRPGQRVERGAPLLILEAMKMEHEICAPAAGTVAGYPRDEGERVMPGDQLVNFLPDEASA